MEGSKRQDITHILLAAVVVLFVLNFYMFVSARLVAAPAQDLDPVVDRASFVCVERVLEAPRMRIEVETADAERLRRRAAVLRRDAERLRNRIASQKYEMSKLDAEVTSSF